MKDFADIYGRLDAATSTKYKQQVIGGFLKTAMADPARWADAAWTLYFLSGGKPRQLIPTKTLRQLALDLTGLPEWLFEESYQNVGDLAETISLLLPKPGNIEELGLTRWLDERLLPARNLPDERRLESLKLWIETLPETQRLAFFKLVTGSLRIGVSKLTVVQALSETCGVNAKIMSQRMMGYTQASKQLTARDFADLIAPADGAERDTKASGQPMPFFLAHAFSGTLEDMANRLGAPDNWLIEWKFDGIRAQFVNRGGQSWIWSRGEDLVSDSYPDLQILQDFIPEGTVLDGELVVVTPGARHDQRDSVENIQPFALLQQRLGRKILSAKLLSELPVALICYDILEFEGQDCRDRPQFERRALLEQVIKAAHEKAQSRSQNLPLRLSPRLTGSTWDDLAGLRQNARAIGAEGMMLKAGKSVYGIGRRKVDDTDVWWKWKLDPMSVDAVLIYAQRGHGRRATLYSDYTFAVWTDDTPGRALTPFAKAYSGLTDEEMKQVDAIIRKTTRESFGPVRSVIPTLVFELGFEGIAQSKRHKSGIAVRFPRMLRWRKDKSVDDADTLASLHALLPQENA